MKRLALLSVAAVLMVGCAGPITNSPLPKLSRAGGALDIDEGFREAKFNLEEAVKIEVLAPDDPALACVTGVMKGLGIDQPEGTVKSFDPKTDKLLGKASVLYINVQQAQKLAGSGVRVPTGCEALIGKMLLDFARAGVKSQPGGGLLPALR